jgi:glyoxylase-like metal-dependent hydrolase (beta-lactamase superfamily II)
MRIHHLNCPTLCPFGATLINGSGGILRRGRMVCHCLLIEGEDGLILVDTGIGTEDMADPKGRLGAGFVALVAPSRDREETALRRVEALGFRRSDVRYILPTHLDLDHAGGLPDFPEAEVHIFRPEQEAALNPPSLAERERYRAVHFHHGPHWQLHDDAKGEPWFGFNGVRPLGRSPDVLIVPLQGHTRGHAGIAVRTEKGWLLHAGDAYFHHGEMAAHPTCPPGLRAFQRLVAVDDSLRRRNQERLRELVEKEPSVTVFSAHCPVEFERLAAVPVMA